VHNDLAAISSFADALMQAGQYETALQVFDEHADRLLAENSDKVLDSLHVIIGHVRDNPDSLQKLLDLFHKAGENTHVTEVTELLAHASVQSGDLARARDLYQKLATLEPQNALHMQNYQQVVSQLGGPSGSKLITPEEAVVLIDDLEATAPAVHQHYTDEIALAIRSALTDAELFISYNMPAKALGPLLGALALAPTDLRVNQRLAALHTRAARFAEAALCCRTLQTVYSEADHPEEASRYNELAERYEERSSAPEFGEPDEDAHIFLDAASAQAEPAVEELSIDGSPAETVAGPTAAPEEPADEQPDASPWPTTAEPAQEITVEAEEPEFAVVDDSATVSAESASGEIDLSSEWDDSLTVEAGAPAGETAEVTNEEAPEVAAEAEPEADSGKIDETIEEIRFYLAHGMPEQSLAALAKLQTLTSDQDKIAELRAEVEAASQPAGEDGAVELEPVIEELTADDIPTIELEADAVQSNEVADEVQANEVQGEAVAPVPVSEAAAEEPALAEPAELEFTVDEPAIAASEITEPEPAAPEPAEPEPAVMEALPAVAEAVVEAEPEPVVAESVHVPTPVPQPKPQPAVHLHAPKPKPVPASKPEPEPEPQPGVLKEFVSDLETSLGDSFLPGTVAKPVAAPSAPPAHEPAAHTGPVIGAQPTAPLLGEFVADIEASLGEDFLKAAPVAKAEPAVSVAQAAPVPAPVAAPRVIPPLAAVAAASASPASHVAPPAQPVASVAWHAPVEAAQLQPPSISVSHAPAAALPSVAPAAPSSAAKSSPFGDDAGVDLAEMFGELKQDLEAGGASADEDPETHYNLGIAFREMGLLDEAIGELQKACQSFDHGHPFPQIMQTYTWLAQCFLDKGVPEAAVRWYDKALNVVGIDGETRVALHYEMASAYEAAGDKPSALKHFMDVYGSNIDYRDVAERIKALKS